MTRASILGAVWPPGFSWPVVACEDASLRGMSVADGAYSHKLVKSVIQLGTSAMALSFVGHLRSLSKVSSAAVVDACMWVLMTISKS